MYALSLFSPRTNSPNIGLKYRNQLKTQPPPAPTPIGPTLAVPSFTTSLAGSSAGAKKNKKSLFGGLVKRKDDAAVSTEGADKDSEGSKSLGKRKEDGDGSKNKEYENKKAKVAMPSTLKSAPASATTTTPSKPAAQKGGLGLVAYDSSSDEDDE